MSTGSTNYHNQSCYKIHVLSNILPIYTCKILIVYLLIIQMCMLFCVSELIN